MQKYLSLLIGAAFVYAAVSLTNIPIWGMVLLCLIGCGFVVAGTILIVTNLVNKHFNDE